MDDIASLTPDNTADAPTPTSPPTDWRDTEAQANLAALGPSAPTFQHDPALSTADAPLGKLKAAGFSDPEIAQWSIQKRQELSQAGFNDGEIDSYLSGAVQPPARIPQAVKDRFEAGAVASKLEGGLAQTIPAGIDLLSSPDGRTKLWNGVQQWLKSTSIADSFTDPLTLPGDVASGKADLSTPEGLDRAIGLGMFVAFGRQSKLPLNGQTSGLALAAGQTIGRIERDPMGSINIQQVGELPKANDFLAAAQDVTGGTADEATQQKLVALYQERGIHPAEVAHDAKTDVTITQDIVSGNDRIEAYHGSPYEIDRFDTSKIGAGEGAQSYGHGLYFAENSAVGEGFRESVLPAGSAPEMHAARALREFPDDRAAAIASLKEDMNKANAHKIGQDYKADLGKAVDLIENGYEPPKGNLYKVRLNVDHNQMLDWDKPFSEQSQHVQDALQKVLEDLRPGVGEKLEYYKNVGEFVHDMQEIAGKEQTSKAFDDAGIPGIKYLDEGSRGIGEGTRNFVVFNDKHIEITHKNGEPVGAAERRDIVKAATREQTAQGGEDVTGGRSAQPPEPPPPGLPSIIEPPAPEPGSFDAAQQKILDKISIGDKGERRWSWKKLYTQMVDDLHPIAAAVKEATGGEALPVSEDAYKLGRLTRGTFGKAEHMLEYGTFDFATNKNIGPSLKEILAPVRDDLNGLRAYLAAKRTIEIEASGRVSGFDLEAAKQVVAQGDKLHAAIADKLATYQAHVLAYLKDSGVLSQKSFDAMQAANRDYTPFFRVMADGQGAGAGRSFGPGSPIKALKGSVRDIVDPLESIIKNTYAFVSIAERNAVGLKLIDTLKEADKNPAYARSLLQNPDYKEPPTLKQIANKREPVDGEIVQYLKDNGIKDPPSDLVAMIRTNAVEPDGNTISAFRDGAKESYTTADTDLVAAFRQLDQHDANMLLKIIALPAKTLRAGAVLTPDFMAKNMIRDFQGAFVNSKGLFSPIDTARGLKSAITKDETFQSWLKSGGANSAMVAIDRRYLQESIEKLTAETGLATRAWNVIKSPLDGLRMISELSENATRVGEYRKGLGKEGLDASKATQQEAGYASREVTLDFSRRGASIQAYNMITAFANANIQGIDRIGRAFKDRPINTTLKIAGGITLPSVLLWYANHDDERYQNLPRWQKDLFWIVLTDDHIYRIPKDFSLGVVFGSGAERAMEAWFGSKNVDPKDAFKGFGGSVASTMLPGAVPTIALPVIEQFANRSTFTNQTLVPDHMEKGLPEYQYTPYTTELGKALGQIVGAFPGISSEKLESTALGGVARSLSSPILIENYVRAWSGGLGVYALQAADMTLRKAGVLPDPPKPASTLSDIPIIRAFTVRYPSASAQPIQDFYDEFDKSKRYYTSYMDKAQEGDAAAMSRIEAAGGPRMFVQLDGIKTVLTEHSQLIRDIYKDPAMPPGQKRQLIDQLYYSMIQVGQQGAAALKQIDDALTPKGAPAQ